MKYFVVEFLAHPSTQVLTGELIHLIKFPVATARVLFANANAKGENIWF